jgi:hypothetical protein
MLCKVDMCVRRVFVALSVAMASVSISAVEVTAQQAKTAVDRWLVNAPSLGCRLGGAVESVRTCTATNGAQFHVAKVAGGGFVVTSADTSLEPIVAFASGGDLEESDANPLWVLLRRDFAARAQSANPGGAGRRRAGAGMSSAAQTENEAKWARLLGGGTRTMSADGDGIDTVSDLRVAPLVQSMWGQEGVAGSPCFNYYTPGNYPCGCVATVGAQIMRYFMWPAVTTTIPQFTNQYCSISNAETVVVRNITLTTQGGSYDWSMMPLVPNVTTSDAERRAIGKLTSDIGICSSMSYSPDGSGTGGYMLAHTLTNHFGYASALAAQWRNSDQSGSDAFRNALLSNFDAGLPVMLSLNGIIGGHAIIGDGYGYSGGALFIHMNFGWMGIGDAWYSPPDLDTGDGYAFNIVDGFVFNILPQLPPSTVICSGRVLDAGGNPVVGALVTWRQSGAATGSGSAVETDSKGIYALMLQPGSYVVTANYGALSSSISVTLQANRATKTQPPNTYYYNPAPSIGNRCGKDITLSGVASVAVPEFDPPSCLFYPTTNVTITCATPGATIRYTLDGTEPTSTSPVYTGPIAISDDTVITAKAWASGMNPSAAISVTYTYDASQGAPKGDYFADPIIISGANGSRVVQDNSAYTVETGEPWHTLNGGRYYYQYKTIWYEWTAPGSGTMTFTSDLVNNRYGTYLAVYVGDSLASLNRICYALWTDGQVPDADGLYNCAPAVATVNVEQGVTYRIVGMVQAAGLCDAFSLTWSGNLTVVPTATGNTPEPVPYAWLQGYFPGNHSSADYDAIAIRDDDGDGYLNWEEYVLQTNPTNAASGLKVSIRMESGVPHVEYTPSTFLSGYHAVIKGTNDLGASPGNWATVTVPTAAYHFFKVVVETD